MSALHYYILFEWIRRTRRTRVNNRKEEKKDSRGTYLADAIDEVAEEEAGGADEELLPDGPVRERHAEQPPPLLLLPVPAGGHGRPLLSASPSQRRHNTCLSLELDRPRREGGIDIPSN